MKARLALIWAVAVITSAGPIRAQDTDNTPDKEGSMALAQRLETFACQTLRASTVPASASAWDQSTALLKAAARLDPKEPRYLRLLIDDLLDNNDTAGAAGYVKTYLQLEPGDQTAQVRLIDLYLADMQGVDQKIQYLRAILAKQQLAPEVRSVAAVRCAQLFNVRAEPEEALKMLRSAIVLNHVNVAAMRMKYDMTVATALPLDRVEQLLSLLQAAPADPGVFTRLAQQLADLGLAQQSVQWYSYANSLYGSTGIRPDAAFARGAGSELLIAGRVAEATTLLSQYATTVPDDPDGWLLWLTASKFQADQNPVDKAVQAVHAEVIRQAGIALSNRLTRLRAAAGDTQAATRPLNSSDATPLPDLSGDPARLRQAGKPWLTDAYVAAVSDLAWFQLYYRRDAAAADPFLAVLGKLLSNRDIQLARLRGWRLYVGGDAVGATTKLLAVQQSDPMAALGLILIDMADPAKRTDALARARQLLGKYPSGLVGAALWGALHKFDLNVEPGADSGAVATALEQFPKDFLQILSQPQSVYIVRIEPNKEAYQFGQPILIRVAIENISASDLAIGSDGALHPDLWFDAYLRGMQAQSIGGAAYDRLSQRLVLPAGQTMSQLVRIDDGALVSIFGRDPGLNLTVNVDMVTNPSAVQAAGPRQPALGQPGPCGYSVQLTRMVQRDPTFVGNNDLRDKLLTLLHDGPGGEKVRILDVLGSYELMLRQSDAAEARAVAEKFLANIRQATNDPKPAVAAYAQFVLAVIAVTPDDPVTVINQMKQSPDWEARLLSLAAATVTRKGAPGLAEELSRDADPLVRAYAAAMLRRTSAATQAAPTPTAPAAPAPTAPAAPAPTRPAPASTLPGPAATEPAPPGAAAP
ncbi:MAG: hypothetical protein ABR964_05180 [Tepidisphaeraceae bacterium]|jgi:tetratricopeptide (TPR) repeat protein